MPSRRLNRILWVTVAVLIAVFAMRAQETLDLALSSMGTLDVRSEAGTGQLYLRWRGKIDAPMAQRLAEAVARNENSISTVVLSLSSPGGSLDHGAQVIAWLGKLREKYRIETIVESRGICASMCVPVYLQGDVRRAAPNARFMFHEVSFHESLSEEKLAVPEKAVGSATDRFFAKYFLNAGVPEEWVRSVRQAIAGGVDIWKTGRELLDERAGIVQRLEQ